MRSRRRTGAPLPLLELVLASVLLSAGALAQEVSAPRPPERGPGATPPGGDAKPARAPAPEPPRSVALPGSGRHRAPVLLRLAGELFGLPVRVDHKRLNEVEVEIPPTVAGRRVNADELRIVLAAHSLYLFVWDHPSAGKVLVAAGSPSWQPPPLDHHRTLEVPRSQFARALELAESAVDEFNAKRPEGARRAVAVAVERQGKILLRSPERALLDEVSNLVARWQEEARAAHVAVRSYRGRFRTASELEAKLLEKLTPREQEEAKVTASPWGNLVFFRARSELAARIEDLLKELDRPEPRAGARK